MPTQSSEQSKAAATLGICHIYAHYHPSHGKADGSMTLASRSDRSCLAVDDRASRKIDEECSRLHHCQLLPPAHVGVGSSKRQRHPHASWQHPQLACLCRHTQRMVTLTANVCERLVMMAGSGTGAHAPSRQLTRSAHAWHRSVGS